MTEEISGGGGNFVASPFIEGEEPRALLKNDASYFTYSDGWVNLGGDLALIDGFTQGILLSDLNTISWWEDFVGVVEVLVFSKTDVPEMPYYIFRYVDTDVEVDPHDVAIDSYTPEAITIEENRFVTLVSETASDSELGNEVAIDSMTSEAIQFDGQYSIMMEANHDTDFSVESESVSLDIDSNLTEPMALEGEYAVLMEGIETTDATTEADFSLDVDSSLTENMTLDGDYSVMMEGIDTTDASTEADFYVDVDSALTDTMTLDSDYSLLMEGIDTTDATQSAEFFVDVDSSETDSMTLEGDHSLLIEGLDTVDNEATQGSIEVDSQQTHDTELTQQLDLYGEATSQVRTLISVNNGREWWTFDVEADDWKRAELSNIDIEGMSIDLLNSLDYFDYEKLVPNKIYMKDLVIATQASSTLDDAETIFRSLEVEYFENQPAFVSNVRLTPDSIHNEYAELRFDVVDLEGDDVFYKVLVKRADEVEYTQIEPNPSVREWNQRPAESSVFHAYNHPYFNTGLNKVQVVVKDSRGLESAHEFDLYLMDQAPYVQLTSDKFGMDLVVGDEHLDSVSYKVSLNGETLIGYTDFQRSPVSFRYAWSPGQLKRDEPNIIRVDVIDSFGNMTVEEFQIQGQFTSLMFTDESGQYLTDNLGQLLSYLDFGAVVGGTISLPKTVKVINETGSAVKNLNIKALNDHLPEGVSVQFSKELMPFEETDNIQYSGVVPFMDQREFHVRIKSDRRLSGIREFEAFATADTEI
jgi:hypothetical protein